MTMSPLNLIDSIKKASETNPVLKDILFLFASRERARSQITLRALTARMQKEKFKHSIKAYADCLILLANLGVGELDKNAKGKVRALKNIKYRLPDLGKAAFETHELAKFRRRPQYSVLPSRMLSVPIEKSLSAPTGYVRVTPEVGREMIERRRAARPYQTPGSKLILTYILNEKAVNIPVPASLTTQEVAELVNRLNGGAPSAKESLPEMSHTPSNGSTHRGKEDKV